MREGILISAIANTDYLQAFQDDTKHKVWSKIKTNDNGRGAD